VSTFSSEELETRRIVLLRVERGAPEVLLDEKAACWALPEVRVTRRQRIAPQLAAHVKAICGIEAIAVSSIAKGYELMEAHRTFTQVCDDRYWVAVDSLIENRFHDRSDAEAVRHAVAQSMLSLENSSRGPFTCLGWFAALEHWVAAEIQPHGLQLTGAFEQLNACPTFNLIRFATDGHAVWFKAVDSPNLREYPLTVALSHLFPRFLPKIIATRPEENGWLAREAEGHLLSECSLFDMWEMVARDLCALQIESIPSCTKFIDLGARNLRTSTLLDLAAPFFQAMDELMERQTKAPPARLTREQLRSLCAQIQNAALALLRGTGIPETLGQLDLNPGNIVCSPGGSVFLDWAEAFVGHPFLSFEYLREHFRRTFGQNHPAEAQLTASYIGQWRSFLSEDEVRRALEAAPLMAVFACAVGNDAWKDTRRLDEPHAPAYLRSLTRRMEREARALAERSLPCLL
jgi:hypothetical protein